jgi:hypothetical protein
MWLIEGVAMYMESLTAYGSYYTLGGFDADRLQFARYRLFNERYYVPLAQLATIGREALKQHEEIRRLYTQSAAMAHYFMDGDGGSLRPVVIELLHLIYDGRDSADSLERLAGGDLATLDEGYRQFLEVTDEDLAQLAPPTVLERLSLGHTQVSDTGLVHLAGYNRLVWLDLAYCQVSDAGLAHLAGCRSLAQLNLEGTRIGDESLALVGGLERLEELDLSQTAVGDAGLAHLAGLTNLRVLWLTGTGVTDAGLEQLAGLEHLEYLNVSSTHVTAEGLAALQRRLPKLNRGE